ncbi:hypothetical protein ACLG6S_04430 [Thermodesulfobacteriota bacterium B35]
MALYNEVIENPYVVRALVTDSRLASSDLLHPGTDAFPLELPQDYEFDNPGNGREVRNPAADEEHGALLDAIADSDSSVDDIVAMHHAPVPLPVELPYGLQNLVNAFGERISALSFTEGDPDTVAVFLSHFQEAYADLAEQTGWPHLTGDTVSPEQVLTLPGIREVVRHYTSLGVQHDGMIHVGPNLGDTVMVDLEPGSFWQHLHMVDNILAQHSPFDDALLLAAEGPLAIIGNQIEAFRESLQVLEQVRQKFEETSRASGMELQGREVTRQIDARMEALHTRIDALEDLRIDKVEEEFGYADTWMRDPGFHPGVMSAGVLEQYRDYLQHGVDGLVSARLYLNGRELSALSGQDSADSDSRAARIEELRKEQIELLHTLHGENLDSWMLTSEFLANPLGEGASAFAALTPEQIEAVRQENAISSLQAEIDRVERILDNRAESRGRTDPVPSDPEQVVAADDAVLHSDVPQDNTTNDSDRDILSLPLEEDQLPGQRIGRVLRTVSLQQNFAGAGSMLPAMGLGLHLFLSTLRPGMVSGPGLAAMPLDQEPTPWC